ncbi:MAG TPA: excinuclease ABC subunit UvrC [Bacteroidales bacterium]|nr:excinuclease ABC subunit UvrC [Bacteroidales bacterium]HSA43958.1 excinuclease ABC subunit UvrC [Bacteroidales bacterium]
MTAPKKRPESIDLILKTLPHKPGVYQFLDDKDVIIYVGKAKDLKKRVSSYFNKDRQTWGKVYWMVKRIADIRTLVVDTEQDAFLLENNLIKKYQPRYNVQLKDDKTFPWICIRNEPFPRVFSTRNVVKDGSQYFGPYASGRLMNTLLELIRQLYPLRNCNLNLSPENIRKKKFRLCLEYHIGNCKGPCEGLQTKEAYQEMITEIRDIIKGNLQGVAEQLKNLMHAYAGRMEFEKAHLVKEKLMLLEKYQSKSTVVNPQIANVDVFTIVSDPQAAYVNFLKVVNGAIIQAHTVEIKKILDEPDDELFSKAIFNLRERFQSNARELIVPFIPADRIENLVYTCPQRGDKKKLLELSERNVQYYRTDKEKQKELVDPERHSKRILEQAKKDLRLPDPPVRIECFDNSNLQGSQAVSAMVVFTNGRPDKKEYRHYNIRTVTGPDDFASMEEVILRRYKRMLDENKALPQLIVIDGGKGQLSAAVKSLESLDLRGKISIIGIAKRLEEIYFPGDPLPLYLDKKSETLRLIQQLRDEAHRFGITHHRKKRQKETIRSVLTDIPGIGYETAQKLLWKFKSVKNISKAGFDDLAGVAGKAKAKIISDYFRNQPS